MIEKFPEPDWGMFCILDGHGGKNAAEFCKENIPKVPYLFCRNSLH